MIRSGLVIKGVSHLWCSSFFLSFTQPLRAGLTFAGPTALSLARFKLEKRELIAGTAGVGVFDEDYPYAVLILLAAGFKVNYGGTQGEDAGASGFIGGFDHHA